MENVDNAETRFIQLPNGNTLEVTIRPGFLLRVAAHFGLSSIDNVENNHIRMYIFGAFKNAVDGVNTHGFEESAV